MCNPSQCFAHFARDTRPWRPAGPIHQHAHGIPSLRHERRHRVPWSPDPAAVARPHDRGVYQVPPRLFAPSAVLQLAPLRDLAPAVEVSHRDPRESVVAVTETQLRARPAGARPVVRRPQASATATKTGSLRKVASGTRAASREEDGSAKGALSGLNAFEVSATTVTVGQPQRQNGEPTVSDARRDDDGARQRDGCSRTRGSWALNGPPLTCLPLGLPPCRPIPGSLLHGTQHQQDALSNIPHPRHSSHACLPI